MSGRLRAGGEPGGLVEDPACSHADDLFSARAITDASGAVLERFGASDDGGGDGAAGRRDGEAGRVPAQRSAHLHGLAGRFGHGAAAVLASVYGAGDREVCADRSGGGVVL